MTRAVTSREIDVDQILETARAIAPEGSVFETSLGVDEDCLSAEKLVALLRQGVRGEDATHLMSCSTCAENVRNLQSVMLASGKDFVGNALKKTSSKTEDLFKDDFFPVVLAIPDKMISVSEQGDESLAFTCGLFPLASGVDDIDVSSLQASGAIISKGVPEVEFVDLNDDGNADFIKLTFPEGYLAGRVREAVSGHQNVVDTVQIGGDIVRNKAKKRLAGQARVEFVNAADLTLG